MDVTEGKIRIYDLPVAFFDGYNIPIRIYKSQENDKIEENRGCLLYIHGGGSIAGGMEMCDNLCIGIAGRGNIRTERICHDFYWS